MRLCRLAGVFLLLACAGLPQDLAPEVLLLARIKTHMHAELSHLPNYTCLETISRFRKDRESAARTHGQLEALDTVRLEIVYSDHKEWYGSPGDRKLGVNDPVAFIGGGMIGNGAFGLALDKILAEAIFTYGGEEVLSGRKAVRYDFKLTPLQKSLHISLPGGAGTVGQEGSLWAGPQSLDLIRVESHAVEIPSSLPLNDASTDVKYARTRIGDYSALLAQQAESHMLEADGVESYNRIDYTHCRAYSTQSDIRFDTEAQAVPASVPSTAPAAPASAGAADHAVPALLAVNVQLTTPVSDGDAVGTSIEGRVSDDVRNKGKIVVPKGSVIRGRIRRLDQFKPGLFIVGLEFTEVEVGGEALPFYADLLRIDKNPLIQPQHSEEVLVVKRDRAEINKDTVTIPELAGVAAFFISGKTFTLPSGFRMVWRTRGPIQGY